MFNNWTYQKSDIIKSKWFSFKIRNNWRWKIFKVHSFCKVCYQNALSRLWSWIHWGLLSFEKEVTIFYLPKDRKKLMIIYENHNLLNVFLAFREFCISYWFKSLSNIEGNTHFSDYDYEFDFWWSLYWIPKLVIMLNFIAFLKKKNPPMLYFVPVQSTKLSKVTA